MPNNPMPAAAPARAGSEPDWAELDAFTASLLDTDGEPLDTPWHFAQIGLLIAMVYCHLRGRSDYFAGGNMFIDYSRQQAMNRDDRGPDFFFVRDVDGTRPRRFLATWEEDSRLPDVIVELLSPTMAEEDRTTKMRIYERTFQTREYFLYDPDTGEFEGWRLGPNRRYQAVAPDGRGWLWSEELQLWLGFWDGTYSNQTGRWLRFYDAGGQLVLIPDELEKHRDDQEKQRADREQQLADALADELARLKARRAGPGDAPARPGL